MLGTNVSTIAGTVRHSTNALVEIFDIVLLITSHASTNAIGVIGNAEATADVVVVFFFAFELLP